MVKGEYCLIASCFSPPAPHQQRVQRVIYQSSDFGTRAQTGQPITRIPGLAILFNEAVFAAPPLLKTLVARWGCLHETVIMVHVRRVRPVPQLGYDRVCSGRRWRAEAACTRRSPQCRCGGYAPCCS